MKRILFIISLNLMGMVAFAQSLSLQDCQRMAHDNHLLLKQGGVIDELYTLKVKSANSSNLPQIDLSARASYQSAVTELNFPIPGFKSTEFAKDQYKVYIDVKQKLFDFGKTKNKKQLELADRNLSLQQNEVDIYKIRETVNSLYFRILALQQNNEILKLKRQSLEERIKIVASAVKNGMSLPNELDNLKAESLMTDQQQMELLMNKQTTTSILAILIGEDISEHTQFSIPVPKINISKHALGRPELKLFEDQKFKLDKSESLLKSSHLPYLFAFGQAGYGRPGLNMLNNEFDNWYMGGIGLAWNLWDGNKIKQDRAIIRTQKKSIDIAREQFQRNIDMALRQELDNQRKLENMLAIDNELVELKSKIAKRSASGLDNGAITSADYIRDLNSALQAQATQNIHQLQLKQAIINFQTILGE